MVNKKLQESKKEAPRPSIQSRGASFIVGNTQQPVSSRFGNTIRIKREQSGITQTELAKLAKLNRSYLSELERGLTNISLERAERLAKALNCSLQDLIS